MNKTIRLWNLSLFALLLTAVSCIREDKNLYSVNLDDLQNVKVHSFKVTRAGVVDLENGFPSNCYIPGYESQDSNVHEAGHTKATRSGVSAGLDVTDIINRGTTSIDGVSLTSKLLDFRSRKKVVEIIGTYQSVDEFGKPVTLSGKILLPANGKFKRFLLLSHYTIGSNIEAPSNSFPLEGVICPLGYCMVIPDYLGFGVTSDRIHPYLVKDVTARNVADMLLAARNYLEAAGYTPQYEDCILMGYSQGGAATMSVQYLIEHDSHYGSIKTHQLFAGGGPYDVRATFEEYINQDYADYPAATLMVLQGMAKCTNLDIPMDKLMRSKYLNKIDEWINSKNYLIPDVNKQMGTKQTSKILTPEAFNMQGDDIASFYSALTDNSIASYNWSPSCPCYVMHSMDDNIVSFVNAVIAKSRWQGSNMEFNFGHYGTHTETMLNFLQVVKNRLESDKD